MAIRVIEMRERMRQRNDAFASDVRARLAEAGVPALNLVSSPGSGKTVLLERTLRELGSDVAMAVVTGDPRTQRDAQRLAQHTTALVQAVVTGDACHLDARQVHAALDAIDLDATDLVILENVGSLVCPADWDLGETARAVVLSVAEGEDKPLKYPRLFRDARWAVLSKLDLLPHVPFDLHAAVGYARDVNPNIELLYTSALTGEGMEEWYGALRLLVAEARGELRAPRVVTEMPSREHAGESAMRRGPGGAWIAVAEDAERRRPEAHEDPDALGMPLGVPHVGLPGMPPPA